jgi:hypothetical protein
VLLPGTDDVVAFTVRGFSSNEIAAMGLALYARYVPLTHTERERDAETVLFTTSMCVCMSDRVCLYVYVSLCACWSRGSRRGSAR